MTRLRSAAFQEPEGDAIRCGLCPHHCRIREGGRGRCGVREVRDGCLVSLVWGRPVALAVDPVEKKPFYHFHPGASCLSLATVGCNLDCDYCQNHSLSRGRPGLERGPQVQPREVVEEALLRGVDILA
ncbi:MAG: radical SAM protein, partial [Deltaproteobacteria bacterium]|nr:radical SAM protein [Deltaproteobacteria bacterium]